MVFLTGCRGNDTAAASAPPPIEIKAIVHPAQMVSIAAQVDGQVRAIDVREGATIGPNGVLVELANPAVERDAAVAHAQLEWIDTRLARGRSPQPRRRETPAPSEITSKIVEMRRQRLETMKHLRRTNDVTTADVEQAELEYLAALRDSDQERRVATGAATPAGEDLALLRIEREKTAAEEQFASGRRALLQIRSPIAGTVTRIQVTPGQAVFARDAIAEVSNTATLHVTGAVAPELLRYIHAGTPVEVKIFTVPPRTFADAIDYVVPVQGNNPEEKLASVVVSIPNPDRSLQPNTEALITLRTR